jgi:CRISPR-associated protein Cas1
MTLLVEGKSTLLFRPKFGDSFAVSGKNFVIRNKDGEVVKKVPALSVRDILVFGESSIDSKIFSLAKSNDIPIHFLDGRGRLTASVRSDFSKNVFLRHAQVLAHDDPAKRLLLARAFVEAKVENQQAFLRKMRVAQTLPAVPDVESLDVLRGYEGLVAKRYFQIWSEDGVIKNSQFSFSGRWKRPALDEVNALLSYSYSLLHAEIVTQLIIAGLDPYFGFLHNQRFGHAALASDFLEIFRGRVDHFVVKSINLREFSDEDFEKGSGGVVTLASFGFQKFFPKWFQFLRVRDKDDPTIAALIEKDIRKLVHVFMGDKEAFNPYRWKV